VKKRKETENHSANRTEEAAASAMSEAGGGERPRSLKSVDGPSVPFDKKKQTGQEKTSTRKEKSQKLGRNVLY